MKKIIVLLLMLFAFTSCSAIKKVYSIEKTETKPPTLVNVTLLNTAFSQFVWSKQLKPEGLQLIVENITNDPVSIYWEESSLNSEKILKTGFDDDLGVMIKESLIYPQKRQTLYLYEQDKIYVVGKTLRFIKGWYDKDIPIKLILVFQQGNIKEKYILTIDKGQLLSVKKKE